MGPGELSLLRQRIAGTAPAPPPFAAAVESLKADTPAQYTPHALKDVYVEWYDGPKIGHKELVEEDGKMVYMQVRLSKLVACPRVVALAQYTRLQSLQQWCASANSCSTHAGIKVYHDNAYVRAT